MSAGAVIFLHGSGDSGQGISDWINSVYPPFFETLTKANIKVICPSAKARPYSMAGGLKSPVWHDRWSMASDSEEDLLGLNETKTMIKNEIKQLVNEGIPLNQIVVGGLSMGGGAALFSVLSDSLTLNNGNGLTLDSLTLDNGKEVNLMGIAGVFSMSSWVTSKSAMWSGLDRLSEVHKRDAPLVAMVHGSEDKMIHLDWVTETSQSIGKRGLQVRSLLEQGIGHELGPKGLEFISKWIINDCMKTNPVPPETGKAAIPPSPEKGH